MILEFSQSCQFSQDQQGGTATGDGKQGQEKEQTPSFVCLQLGNSCCFFFPLSYLSTTRSPKMEQECRDIRFFSHFSPGFWKENHALLWAPVLPAVIRVPTATSACVAIPAAHKNSPEDPSQPWNPRGREWAWTVISGEHFKQHLRIAIKREDQTKICSQGSRGADSKLWIPRAMINPWKYCCLTSYQSFLSPTWVLSSFQEMNFCGWTLCLTPSVKP